MKVKTDYVPGDCRYLTAGKEYDVVATCIDGDKDLFAINSDSGFVTIINVSNCAHLKGEAWEVVEE